MVQAEIRRRAIERDRGDWERDPQACRDRCKTLAGFIREAWHVLHTPNDRYIEGWHIDLLCEHLEAITYGRFLERGLSNRLLVNVPPGSMKPVSENEWILERTRGRIRLRDIVVGDEVLTHCSRFRRVLAVHSQGVLPTVIVRTSKGRAVRAAPDHPFLTPRGWIAAGELIPGDVVGAVKPQETSGTQTLTKEAARLLGYLVGDGCTKFTQITVTNMDPGIIADVHRCAASLGFFTREKIKHKCRAISIVIKSTESRWTAKSQSPLRRWIEQHDLTKRTSYTKRVPPAIMAATSELIAEFLGAYWSCDGGIFDRERKQGTPRLIAETVSAGLALDLQHILLRLGISAGVRKRTFKLQSKRQGSQYTSYSITVDAGDGWRFGVMVPMAHAGKEAAARKIPSLGFIWPLAHDEVISVDPAEACECRCLTVEDDNSFTAGDIAVHNSLLVNVFWPCWEWGPCGLPWLQYIATSYKADNCARDSRRMRALIESKFFQTLWPLALTRAGEMALENERGGLRQSVPFNSLTQWRAHRLLIDDPHSIDTAESDVERDKTSRRFRESATTRLIDPITSAIILIMQRLHQNDLSGIALALKLGYVHVMLPMEFEPDRRCETPFGRDPRTYDGELLCEERSPREVVERDKTAMTVYAVAGQFQQRPSPREGGLFKRHYFKTVERTPPDADMVPVNSGASAKWVRHWDLAASTQQRSARTAGVKMGKARDGRYIVSSVIVTRSEGNEVRKLIRATAELDGRACEVSLPQDPGQAGKVQKQDMVAMLAGFVAHARPETGDKYTRAEPFASQCEAGNVYLVAADWNEGYVEEHCLFPAGALKDQVDASSGAFARLPKTQYASTFAVPPEITGRPRDIPGGGSLGSPPSWSGRPERGGGAP